MRLRSIAQTNHNISRVDLFPHLDRTHQKGASVGRIATTPDFAQTLFAKPRKHSVCRHSIASSRVLELTHRLHILRCGKFFRRGFLLASRVPASVIDKAVGMRSSLAVMHRQESSCAEVESAVEVMHTAAMQ